MDTGDNRVKTWNCADADLLWPFGSSSTHQDIGTTALVTDSIRSSTANQPTRLIDGVTGASYRDGDWNLFDITTSKEDGLGGQLACSGIETRPISNTSKKQQNLHQKDNRVKAWNRADADLFWPIGSSSTHQDISKTSLITDTIRSSTANQPTRLVDGVTGASYSYRDGDWNLFDITTSKEEALGGQLACSGIETRPISNTSKKQQIHNLHQRDQEEDNVDRLCRLMMGQTQYHMEPSSIQQSYGGTCTFPSVETATTEGLWGLHSYRYPSAPASATLQTITPVGFDLCLTKPLTTSTSTRWGLSVFSVPSSPTNVTFATGFHPTSRMSSPLPLIQHDIQSQASSDCVLPYKRPIKRFSPLQTPLLSTHSARSDLDMRCDDVPTITVNTSHQRRQQGSRKGNICNYCRNNKEMKQLYMSHRTHVNGIVTCPVLRQYVCPICGATGDTAHTVSYCPVKPRASMAALTKTPRKSCGCQRNK